MQSSPRVKICGNTNEEDVKRLIGYGVDSLGFIVTERDIPSRVESDTLSKLIKQVPSNMLSVIGVGKYSVEKIVEICRKTGADVMQLQRGGSLDDIAIIRKALPNLKIWKVFFTDKEPDLGEIVEFEKVSDAIMIHGKEEQWPVGLKIAKQLQKPFVLAGGLNVGNIKRAIDTFNPWMVDLISGVETVPGKKDFRKVEEFIQAVKD